MCQGPRTAGRMSTRAAALRLGSLGEICQSISSVKVPIKGFLVSITKSHVSTPLSSMCGGVCVRMCVCGRFRVRMWSHCVSGWGPLVLRGRRDMLVSFAWLGLLVKLFCIIVYFLFSSFGVLFASMFCSVTLHLTASFCQ